MLWLGRRAFVTSLCTPQIEAEYWSSISLRSELSQFKDKKKTPESKINKKPRQPACRAFKVINWVKTKLKQQQNFMFPQNIILNKIFCYKATSSNHSSLN